MHDLRVEQGVMVCRSILHIVWGITTTGIYSTDQYVMSFQRLLILIFSFSFCLCVLIFHSFELDILK